MIKNIFSFLSIFSFLFLAGCGGSSGASSSPTTQQPTTANPTVSFTSYESDNRRQQEPLSVNLGESTVSDIDDPKITQVSFQVEVTGGYEGFSYNLADITINGNSATTITENKLVFEGSFQSFFNNKWGLNVDLPGTNFKGFGAEVKFTEIKTTVNNTYTNSTTPSFTLTIEKSKDLNSIEFIENNSIVTEKTLIGQVKAESDTALCEGYLDIHFGEYNPELAGKMYNQNTPDNPFVLMNQIDLSMLESVTVVNNLTQEEATLNGSENMTMVGIPIDMTSHDNRLDFSIYLTKMQGMSLANVGVALNLRGFNDCHSENTLHQNRWKYLENSISFYDSYLEMKRITQEQSGVVEDQIEKKIEDYILNVLKCETCLGEVILNNVVYNYDSINVDVSTSSIKFLIDGLPVYDGVIVIDENDKFVFSPEVTLSGESNLEVSVVMNVLDVNQTAKFGIYPETFTFFIVETGETITLDYKPGQIFNE